MSADGKEKTTRSQAHAARSGQCRQLKSQSQRVTDILHTARDPGEPEGRRVDSRSLEREAQTLAAVGPSGTAPQPLHRPNAAATRHEQRLSRLGSRSGTTSLQPAPRASMEKRLGTSLPDIRINTGRQSAAVARALGTRAWTFGNHIGFADGAYDPGSSQGSALLTHETVHVLQQAGGPGVMQLDDPPTGVTFFFSVRVDREMTSDELLIEFIQQYSHLPDRQAAEAARDTRGWRWSGTPQTADADDVRQGYVLIHVRDNSLQPTSSGERREIRASLSGMADEERQAIYSEADTRFWEATQYNPGEPLGDTPDDRRMAAYWLHIRDNLVRTRQSVLDLPEHVRDILFDPSSSRRLAPADYETALRVGERLADMSMAELADWRSRITAVTDDWGAFEASLEAYLRSEAERRREQQELARMSARLYGLEELYTMRANLRATERLSSLPTRDGLGPPDQNIIRARSNLPGMRERMQQALRQNGFDSMADFEAAIAAWREGFERETVRVGDVLLDRLDHLLFEAQRRYADPAQIAALATAVSASGAPEHFASEDRQASRSIRLAGPSNVMTETPIDLEGSIAAASASAREARAGTEAMRGLSSDHPLLGMPDFPLGELGRAGSTDVSRVVNDFIAEHRASIRATRIDIHTDSDFLYRLDNLLLASKEAQGIESGSIYERIIDDHISAQGLERLLTGIAVGLIAIALTIASFGTGSVAVAAGVGAFGIGAWQAVDAFQDYMQDSRAADAQLLSQDPTIFWLVVAVVGAAVDLGAATAAVRAMRPAALALNETGDLIAFRRAVEELPDINRRILDAAEGAASAQHAMQGQLRAILAIGGRANEGVTASIEAAGRLMVVAWHLSRRGMYRFRQFLLELQQARIIRAIEEVSPEELSSLREIFLEGSRRASDGFLDPSTLSSELRAALPSDQIDDAAAFGRTLGLDDAEVTDVLEMQARIARDTEDATELSASSLRRAMQERLAAGGSANPNPSMAEHLAGVRGSDPRTGAGVGDLSRIDRPRGSPRPGQLSGDLGEATELASEGARRLPPTYASHLSRELRSELRQIFSNYGDDALRRFTDQLDLPADGLRQVELPVPGGTRRVDRLFREGEATVLREVKHYPRATLRETERIGTELERDLFLLGRYPDAIVDWHITGNISETFLRRLEALEIAWPGRFRLIRGNVFNIIP